ncbi:MAG: caspase family protein [Burkholderiales bacterium]|nr:caspase family protein [Burkholderiales bacterium]
MSIRVLCIHGVNTNENGDWLAKWQQSIRSAAASAGVAADAFEFHELRYNAHFEAAHADGAVYAEAVKRLWNSYWAHRRALGRAAEKGLGTLIDNTIGMVAKWTALPQLRQQLTSGLTQTIKSVNPHVICAHSLGSLISYDTLAAQQSLAQDRLFVTLGSQIGHPALAESFGGYLKPLTTVRHWYHLFNAEDAVLTCELDFPEAPYTQLDTYFDEWGPLDHSAEQYLAHEVTASNVWAGLAGSLPRSAQAAKPKPAPAVGGPWFKAPTIQRRSPRKRRALLIGINEYPQPENRLSGCVNDVFQMSAMLQERGYQPEEIRVVLDARATTRGVNERLKWLLEDVRAGDERVLFYSGHGAQVAALDADGEPDHKDEALVTYDFDWSGNTGITDDMLAQYYANLPYEARFSIILDCCHSGGIARAGGVAVRGINPPDDVRHRGIEWDVDKQMWFPRKKLDLRSRMNKAPAEVVRRYLGMDGATQKMGRAVGRWSDDPTAFKAATKRLGHHGPYNPVLLAACREDQYAYEYTHGSVPYGAMTFMLIQQLRATAGRKTLEDVVTQCNSVLKSKLGYEQEVQLYRPREHQQTRFPGKAPVAKKKA